MNPIACKTKTSKTPTQEKGFEIIFSAQFSIRQTWSTDRFSFDTLILITRLLFLRQFSKSQLSMAKYKGNLVPRYWESCDSWKVGLEESLKRLVSAIAEINGSLSMRNVCTQKHSDDQLRSFPMPPKTRGSTDLPSETFGKRNCDLLPVFGFRSASFDITLIQSYLLPIWTTNKIQNPWLSKRLSTESLSISVEQKLNQDSRRLSCAARVNLGFVFVLNSIQRGKFRGL